MPRPPKAPLEDLTFDSAEALDAWLAKHHATSPGIWLHLGKKGASVRAVSYPEARDLALVWGWIDGQAKRIDDDFYAVRYTPRGAKSLWAALNVERVEALLAAGKMQPSGVACVEAAKADGRWARAYAPPSKATVPDDLHAAFAKDPRARTAFEALDGANRYAILFRLQNTKTPAARAKKLAALVDMLARGETVHPRPAGKRA